MARRGNPDPVVLQAVSERLARLLAENEPRRADEVGRSAADPPTPPDAPTGALAEELPPEGRRFQRVHLAVVAALLLVGLLAAGWSLVRARPVPLVSARPVPSSDVLTETAAPPSPSPSPSASTSASMAGGAGPGSALVVHVLGAVREPGLVRLRPPARVQDAVDAAGGFTRAADPGQLNLAQLLTDGQQVLIGTRASPEGQVRGSGGSGSGAAPTGGSRAADAAVDLNAADAAQLEELPGVGPVTATKILAWRDEHGRFARVEELQEVDGIGPKTYAEIAPHVRV